MGAHLYDTNDYDYEERAAAEKADLETQVRSRSANEHLFMQMRPPFGAANSNNINNNTNNNNLGAPDPRH